MCEAKDFPPSERDELMGLVTQLQGQVAQLTAAKEDPLVKTRFEEVPAIQHI